jgi:carbon monoxide dehydrogenase subunit G
MNISGEYTLTAAPETVWAALLDPEVLRTCIPGGEEVVATGERAYSIRMTSAIGPLKARMAGTLSIVDAAPPHSCTLMFEGSGGGIGFAKGSSSVELAAQDGGGTLLSYTADTQINGKLAQLGSRLIGSVAKKLSGEFFDRFEATMKARAATADPSAT